jgi:hypothetical protein
MLLVRDTMRCVEETSVGEEVHETTAALAHLQESVNRHDSHVIRVFQNALLHILQTKKCNQQTKDSQHC